MVRDRGRGEAELLEQPRRRVEVGDEVREVVEAELAGSRPLPLEGLYFSPPRPSERLMTSFMISFVPP